MSLHRAIQPTNPVLTFAMIAGAAFQHHRKRLGVGQAQVAKALAMYQSGFSKIERGEAPFTASMLSNAVQALNAIVHRHLTQGETPMWTGAWCRGLSDRPISAAGVMGLAARAADLAAGAGVTVLFIRRHAVPQSMQMRILGRPALGIFVRDARMEMDKEAQ